MRTINVAVIGSGFMGAAHVDALRRVPGVRVAAIASADRARAQEIAGEFDIPVVLDDWRALLDRADVDAVHNCTPNNLHYEVNRSFIEAGKHVVSEKPLTMTSAESAELVRRARARGVVTAINFNYRGYPLVQQARGMVERGDLGTLFLVHGHYLQDWLLFETDYNWRLESRVSGASRAVADIGSHWCDLVQFVTGRKITRGIGHRDRSNEVLIKDPALLDDRARAYAHYPGGHPEGYPDGPRNLFGNLYRYIREGRTPGRDAADFPTFEDGHAEVVIVEAVLRSHERQAWVDVE